MPQTIPADDLHWLLNEATKDQALAFYGGFWEAIRGKGKSGWDSVAALGRADLYFLLTELCRRPDAQREWIYARCREVQRNPNGYLDLWAREHYKSTVITFALTIQDILNNPEETFGLFSFNFTNAKNFARQIKREFESNDRLHHAYPEVLYRKPEKEAPQWSEEKGIIVRRKGNPKEATLTPHGLIEGLPAGPHYDKRIYDDIITEDHVGTPEMMQKAIVMYRQSQNLGKEGGVSRVIGTRYHFNDPYSVIISEQLMKVRTYPATTERGEDGRLKRDGKPVLVSSEYMEEKRKFLGPYIFACQWLLDPVADDAQSFDVNWIRYHKGHNGQGLNKYILVDPASEKKKTSDYTAIWVVGLGPDRNYYILDAVHDRLNLTERADHLFRLHRQWRPINVGYEKYGQQADIEHHKDRMERENYRFSITPLGGNVRKEDRIRGLVPLFEQSRVYMPEMMWRESDGKKTDLINYFIEQEYRAFPVSQHDDMLDCLARLNDPEFPLLWPLSWEESQPKPRDRYARKRYGGGGGSWMSV